MTYQRPSYEQLRDRIATDLAAMPDVLRKPLSATWAKVSSGEHGHLDWLYVQCSPLTCEEERLSDWALLYGVDRLQATRATGAVDCTGSPGASLLAGASARASNGLDYMVTVAVEFAGVNATAQLRCATAGAAGNLPAGAKLTLIDPVGGVSSDLLVAVDGIGGGAEQETVENWRARVADEWMTVTTEGARGGRKADYVFWAMSAHPSVTGALVQMHTLGLGTVLVRPICNGLPNRLPSAAVLSAVAAKLANAAPYMPECSVAAPDLLPVAIQIDLAPVVDTAPSRTAIAGALTALVASEISDGAVLALAEIDAAIAPVTTQYTRLAPLADVVCGPGQILALPNIAWA